MRSKILEIILAGITVLSFGSECTTICSGIIGTAVLPRYQYQELFKNSKFTLMRI
ncbi:hypothetical protein HZA97_02040 [Candidatus Woesearchaeota archaeon]|nr:hypothetical protein [Candidatus Woesearchaeota archaeon]